ncbi:6-aminohexanoate-cyclic-dimer hydrolase [Levilactobacillus zymae DSM 19395]|nr:6-aminohexanoate-cyclic-dimer hydrolase [Levilactobacillus zymae DSM 19395]
MAAAIRSGKVTSVELVKQAFAKLKADNPHLNAVITLREKQALQEAASLKDTGQPFLGVPILIKGLGQAMAGESNTNGLLTARQATYSKTGTFVANLQKAGFIVIGQTNFPEMGLLNVTTSKLYGDARNAWNPGFQPGGSSGGSATSVADGIVPIATGNDAGGSIRIPASWSGLVGLKPTQSIIQGDSHTGHGVNFAETKTMADTEALFNALATNQAQPAPKTLKHVTVAYSLKSPVNTPVSPDAIQAVQQAVKFLEQQGIKVKQVDPPLDGVALMKDYYVRNTSAGAYSAQLTKTYQKREMVPDDVSPLNWGLYQASKNVTAQQLKAAETEIDQAANTMENFHQKYTLLLQPTTATTAPSIDDPSVLPENEAKLRHMETIPVNQQMPLIYDSWLHGLTKTPYTQQANLTDEPAISLPTYVSAKGMPLGIQFNAAKGQDRLLMKVGELFEQHHQFKLLQDQTTTETTTTPSTSTDTTPTSPSESAKPTTPAPTQPSVTAPTSPAKPTVQPSRTVKAVYLTKAFKLYQNVTNLTVKRSYSAHSRATAPHFKVTGIVTLKNGQRFYRVKGGYIRVNAAAHNLYYQRKTKRVAVIAKHGIYEYRHATLKANQRVKLVKPKTVLKVKKIVFQGHVTRYQLTNGHYITANRQFIQWR